MGTQPMITAKEFNSLLKIPAKKHQVFGANYALDHSWSVNGYQMGCLTADTKIKVNRGGCSRERTIENLFKIHNDLSSRADTKIPSLIRSFKEDKNYISLNKVEGVMFSGKKQVYLLQLEDGKKIKATKDHRFLTKVGFKKLEDISPSVDQIMVDNLTRHKCKKISERVRKPKKRYNLCIVGEYHPFAQKIYTNKNSKVKETKVQYRALKHRAIIDADRNNITLEDFIKKTFRPNDLKYYDPEVHHVHHIDNNHKNNSLDNLEVLTYTDHSKIEGTYGKFGHGLPEYSLVVSIKALGVEDTYDICCKSPYNNFVANGMVVHNSGKTLVAIIIALQTRLKTVVVCPAFLKINWQREFDKFSKKNLKVRVLYSKDLNTFVPTDEDVLILNYDILKKADKVLAWGKYYIADECHALGNPKSQRTKIFYGAVMEYLPERMLNLSGSPIKGKVGQWYSLIKMCGNNPQKTSGMTYTSSYTTFQDTFCHSRLVHVGSRMFKKFYGLKNEEGLRALLKDKFLRKCPDFELELPKLSFEPVMVNYEVMEDELKELFLEFEKTNKLSDHLSSAKKSNALAKVPFTYNFTKNMVDSGEGPAVVYTDHPVVLGELGKLFSKAKISYTIIDGSTPVDSRQEYVDMFQSGKTDVFLATIGAASEGITITISNKFIFNDKSWNSTSNEQAHKRIHRLSQTRDCIVYSIYSGKVDKMIDKINKEKDHVIRKTVDFNKLDYL